MFAEVLPGNTQATLAVLVEQNILPDHTYLAGGTAVALQLGHRISYDLDFFSPEEFEVNSVLLGLQRIGFRLTRQAVGTILGEFPDVQFSFFHYPYKVISPLEEFEAVRLLGLPDLIAMKIDAISSRGTKRDFIDLFMLLPHVGGVNEALALYERKYGDLATQRVHLLKSLDYFADADPEEMPHILAPIEWEAVKEFFKCAVRELAETY